MTDIIQSSDVLPVLGLGSSDANLDRIVNSVNAWIKRKCGRQFLYPAATFVEVARGWGLDRLFLREAPIHDLVEVRVDYTGLGTFGADTIVTDLTKFTFEADPTRDDPRLYFLGYGFPETPRAAKVTYNGGYRNSNWAGWPDVPSDLTEELVLEAAERYRRGSAERFQSATAGSFNFTRFDGEVDPTRRARLDRYRKRWL